MSRIFSTVSLLILPLDFGDSGLLPLFPLRSYPVCSQDIFPSLGLHASSTLNFRAFTFPFGVSIRWMLGYGLRVCCTYCPREGVLLLEPRQELLYIFHSLGTYALSPMEQPQRSK